MCQAPARRLLARSQDRLLTGRLRRAPTLNGHVCSMQARAIRKRRFRCREHEWHAFVIVAASSAVSRGCASTAPAGGGHHGCLDPRRAPADDPSRPGGVAATIVISITIGSGVIVRVKDRSRVACATCTDVRANTIHSAALRADAAAVIAPQQRARASAARTQAAGARPAPTSHSSGGVRSGNKGDKGSAPACASATQQRRAARRARCCRAGWRRCQRWVLPLRCCP